jgi:hypothetical protein
MSRRQGSAVVRAPMHIRSCLRDIVTQPGRLCNCAKRRKGKGAFQSDVTKVARSLVPRAAWAVQTVRKTPPRRAHSMGQQAIVQLRE